MTQAYHTTASAILRIASDPGSTHLAFAIDRAVWVFGSTVEDAMDRAQQALGNKAKQPQIQAARNAVLQSVLTTPDEAPRPGQFRDPAARARPRR